MNANDILHEEDEITAERSGAKNALARAGLSHTVGELPVLRPPVTCPAGSTVREAIEVMQREQIGYVVVVEDGLLVGIFTERDVLNKIAAKDVDIDTQLVDKFMISDPEVLRPDYNVAYAINHISVGGYRHIPIVDTEGRPVNVLSARNIVEYLADLFPKEVLNLPLDPDQVIPDKLDGG